MTEVINLSKKYGDNQVICNFSLQIAPCEHIALTGPSGCGKTTLLRIISGIEKQDCGEIVTNQKIAYMQQEPRLLPWKTAEENVSIVLKNYDSHSAKKYLDEVNLNDTYQKYPGELSGGMAQRVSFARFLAYADTSGANLLLLDEPFSALDFDASEQMLHVLLNHAKDKSLLLVTHSEKCFDKFDRIVRLG